VRRTKVLTRELPHRFVGEQLLRRPDVHDPSGIEHDRVARDALHDAEVLLDEQDGCELGDALQDARHLRDEQRREPLRRLVDEQEAVVVEERPRDRHHLLLAAREGAGELLSALLELREEVVDELVPRLLVTLGEPEVLVHREAGEDVAVFRDIADATADDLVRRRGRHVLARKRDPAAPVDEAHQRTQRGRLTDAVTTEERGDAAFGDVEVDALQDVRFAEIDVQIADRQERAHSASPR
jgi:hypothetical protein